jgi:hypothetical protein
MCGVKMKVVISIEGSVWVAQDTSYYIPLVERTTEHFEVDEALAGKAYPSRKNLSSIQAVGGMHFVPFKSNALELTEAGAWAKMRHYLIMYERAAFMEQHHKRSIIEATCSMIKSKFGSALRSKSNARQINEACGRFFARTSASKFTICMN